MSRQPRPAAGRAPGPRASAAILCAALAVGAAVAACSGRAPFRPAPGPSRSPAAAQTSPGPGRRSRGPGAAAGPGVLAGRTVGIDPGHNGDNKDDPAFLNQPIFNGRETETCDTTGTQTASGYTEARFNFNVARDLRAMLLRQGARVVMTRHDNHGVGPCVTTRARILDRSGARVAIDIHADGGPVSGRGFTVLEPVADGPNDKVIAASLKFGRDVHAAFLADTPMRVSDYYGQDGYIFRNDLAGLNLTTVPKVLVECGNMTNPADAALLVTARVQRQIAYALDRAIVVFLTGH